MKKTLSAIFLASFIVAILFKKSNQQAPAIFWNADNTASNCTFKNNDLVNKLGPRENCLNECKNQIDCTHFSWSTWNGGTCWMKRGSVTKADAVFQSGNICGITVEAPEGGYPYLPGRFIWSDEFNSYTGLNQNWIQQTGGNGFGNNELQ